MADDGERTLFDSRARKITAASTQRVRGVPVQRSEGDLQIDRISLPFPIFWCLCVHDSPDSPCPCRDIVIWLPTVPQQVIRTKDRDASGADVYEFVLDADTKVFVELQMPVQIGDMERVVRRARLARQGRIAGRGCDRPDGQVMRAPDKGWVGLAAGVGWAVGTVLDDLLGSNEGGNDNYSDDLSDWYAENLPAPDWLQDIF